MKLKWSVIAVVAFLVLFFGIRSCEAYTEFEIGPVITNSDVTGVVTIVSEVFADKYAIGLGLLSDSFIRDGDWEPFMLLQVQRYVTYGPLTLGLGGTYWQNKVTDIADEFTFTEMIRFNLFKGVTLSYRHWSNGGAGSHGLGEDALLIGIKF